MAGVPRMLDRDEIRAAISFIPAHDRDTWVLIGMAVKSELGNDGFGLWDEWSATSESTYDAGAARSVWRSIKAQGGVTIRSLFRQALNNGWTPTREQREMVSQPRARSQADIEAERAENEKRQQAARFAGEVIQKCRTGSHPYLDRKGFPQEVGLIDYDGRLVIPMRNIRDHRRVQSLQWIDAEGEKRFVPGGAAKAAALTLGRGNEAWLCEGYATGLSVRAALKSLYRDCRVVVCFSAGNIAHVAAQLSGRRFVVADNDQSGTGQRFAEKTGLPWCMPPTVGHDANDMHLARGLPALASLLREIAL
jgi:putative DNA primase/helicase